MTLSEFFEKTHTESEMSFPIRPRIFCMDGFSMSVQAGRGLYSSPRSNVISYTAAEIGYPTAEVFDLMEYAEDKDAPTQTVYGYVPVTVIEKVIADHGGIDVDKTFAE